MEYLQIPVTATTAMYNSVAMSTGSSLLGMVVVTLFVCAILYVAWKLCKWIYRMFTDNPEASVKEVIYYDTSGKVVESRISETIAPPLRE